MPPLYWRAAKPAIADSVVTPQSHKWLLDRPLLVPRRARCFTALRSYSQRFAPLYAA